MGNGSSGPALGLPVNPRVQYTDKRSKNANKAMLIDAPVLVKLEHGTVRYRYQEDGENAGNVNDRIERPYESQEQLNQKQGYFYHSRLNKFGQEAAVDKEQPWKFAYVYKGAERTKQKQVYYVFGKGLKTNEDGFIEPKYQSQAGQSFTQVGMYKAHGHAYFDLHFMKQDAECEDEEKDEKRNPDDELEPESEPTITELIVKNKDRVAKIKNKMGIRLMKPSANVHIYYHGEEVQSDQLLGPMRSPAHGNWTRFAVMLHPK